MQVIVRNNRIIATHKDSQDVDGLYDGADIYTVPNGTYVEIGSTFSVGKVSLTLYLKALRIKRDMLLLKSDWTQLPDCPLTAPHKALWAAYRQALRDLPSRITSAGQKIPWPSKPSGNQGFSDVSE